MSNHLAVATVSAALRNLIDDAAGTLLGGVATNVEVGRPDRLAPADNAAAISIFLYQVSHNPHLRNDDLPTRRSDSAMTQRPQVALDLYYLLTFFGVENRQHPELLLGRVAAALHAEPILSRQRIENVLVSDAHLAQSDLASSPELVRFDPVGLNLEELSKLWSVFFQTHYRLSVAYKGSTVLVSPEDAAPRPTLPVATRNLYVETLAAPRIEGVSGAGGPLDPVVIGGVLVIRGQNLSSADCRVVLSTNAGESEALPEQITASEVRISLSEGPFSAGSLRAGVVAVRIVHYTMMGTPPTPHPGPKSNVCAAVIHPSVEGLPLPATAAVTNYALNVAPLVGPRQPASLLLSGEGRSVTLDAAPRSADTSVLSFDLSGVAPGTYLLRVNVDGAESLLEYTDTDADSVPDRYTFLRTC